jgi:hypothetical protein
LPSPVDLATSTDLGGVDGPVPDFATADLAYDIEMAVPVDLGTVTDLAIPADLYVPPPDLTVVHLSMGQINTAPSGSPITLYVTAQPPTPIAVSLTATGPGTMTGTVSGVTDVDGHLVLSPAFDRAGTWTLYASAPNAVSAIAAFRVAGVPRWTVNPTSTVAGQTMSPAPVVTLVDATGAVDAVDGDAVTLIAAPDSRCPAIFGSATTVRGVATFSNLVPRTACRGYRERATTNWSVVDEETAFDVSVGSASGLAIVTDWRVTAEVPFTARVDVVDDGGNIVDVSPTTISLSLAGAALAGTTTRDTVGGSASFSGLTVDHAGALTLTATGGGWSKIAPLPALAWDQRSIYSFVVEELTIDPANRDNLYAAIGIYGTSLQHSSDGGATFSQVAGLPYGVGPWLAMDQTTSSTLYVFAADAVYRSRNGGLSWVAIDAGLPSGYAHTSVVTGPIAGEVYAIVDGGLYRSGDSGDSFALITPSLANVSIVAVHPLTDTLWIATTGAVWTSGDGGAHWSDASGNLPSACAGAIVLHPSDPQVAYRSCSGGGYRTADAGATWSPLPAGPDVGRVAIDGDGTWYSAVGSSSQLWKSADGQAWYAVPNPQQIRVVWPVHGHSGELYGASAETLFRTLSAGE